MHQNSAQCCPLVWKVESVDGVLNTGKILENSIVGSSKIDDLPDNVVDAYKGYSKNGWKGNYKGQAPGTNAAGTYFNKDKTLPVIDSAGNSITYKEFDVNDRLLGMRRDSERLLKGSSGKVYYTNDHYRSFIEIE